MTFTTRWLLDNALIPWRARNKVYTWLYASAKDNYPFIFRKAFLGRWNSLARALTKGPSHHFFGYYDKTPWSKDERMILCHRVGFMDRPPKPDDMAEIGIIDFAGKDPWHKISKTYAWNWQQGSMLRWHPTDPDTVIFNDREGDRFVTRFLRWQSGDFDTIARPMYAISPDGRFGYSVNFSRLQDKRPGYGYAGVPDRWAHEYAPGEDGIWRINLSDGHEELLITLADLFDRNSKRKMTDVPHWVNHLQISPSGRKFLFLHRWGKATAASGFESRLYCSACDGSRLECLLDEGVVSHYDWMDDDFLVVWAEHPSSGRRFYQISTESKEIRVIGDGILHQDGHCNFSPDRKWLVTDTYADQNDLRALMIFSMADGKRVDLDLLKSPRSIPAEIRCDFHPRWSPSGRYLCIDSLHEGTRQMYVLDVKKLLK